LSRNSFDPAEEGLADLVQRGGVYYNIPGDSPKEALTNIIETVQLPASIKRNLLLEAVLEREALMSTSVGRGIALPHPRNPIIAEPSEQFVAITFLSRPVDWNALDGKTVQIVMLIVSASAKLHLHTLSKINFLCHQEVFYALLDNRSAKEEIILMIKKAEQDWK
jgi:PTS system nitrogen regulatory IIA component